MVSILVALAFGKFSWVCPPKTSWWTIFYMCRPLLYAWFYFWPFKNLPFWNLDQLKKLYDNIWFFFLFFLLLDWGGGLIFELPAGCFFFFFFNSHWGDKDYGRELWKACYKDLARDSSISHYFFFPDNDNNCITYSILIYGRKLVDMQTWLDQGGVMALFFCCRWGLS